MTDTYWLLAKQKTGTYHKPTKNAGKWLIFTHGKGIDDLWAKIKKATEEGNLGPASKVSTAKPNPNAKDPDIRVICVYTYDWTDRKDVQRVRQELRNLGLTRKIPYKADIDTLKGKYAVSGHRKISKYYE